MNAQYEYVVFDVPKKTHYRIEMANAFSVLMLHL